MKKSLLLGILCLFGLSLCTAQNKHKEKRTVKLLFVGDAMQHKSQIDGARTKAGYDYSKYFKHIKSQVDSADIAIVNLEVTLAGKPYTGYPSFSAPDEFAVELKNTGFDVFLTANNHILDKRKRGLERTNKVLDTLQVKHLGSYIDAKHRSLRYPLMLIKNGIRIALLNYTYGTNDIEVEAPNIVNYIDKKQIKDDIDSAKAMNPDIIIANMHWGYEYKLKPHKEQTTMADWLIGNGVNLVIGSHPHVVQPIDIRKENDSIKQVVVYSLGNFISGMKAENTDGGMMVNINISKVDNKPVTIDTCHYSLVWVYKPEVNEKQQFQLLPVNKYEHESHIEEIGQEAYDKMMKFARTARTTIESMWEQN
ncbi:CapA family protein [Dysgonomonas sp. 216]|uniref:CapA family protein n=1 Tax=Dysgonomonas sp. 216 TaxID=2302934 RepID=UPI0013D1EE8A|nr:CapA family protein [Dysgonomonas sp. 216]NDW17563.1 CapA family protein [Dysgonomonas sp. 216]